jgi:hypothetical protein
MANEFVAKNGLISQNNTTVTGSLIVTNGVTASLQGTASWADSASQALSASYALSSSYASVNLQQVTDQGNITTNNILIGSNDSVGIPYLGFWDEDEEDYGRLYFFNNEFRITDYAENPFVSFGPGTITIPGDLDPLATSTIYSPYNNVSRNINLPDQDGTLVLSVNGTTADTSGSITLTTVPTASYVTGSIFTDANPALSASYALTASYAMNGGGGGGGGGTSLGLVYAVSLGYLMP